MISRRHEALRHCTYCKYVLFWIKCEISSSTSTFICTVTDLGKDLTRACCRRTVDIFLNPNSCPPVQQIQEYYRMKMTMLIWARMMNKRSYLLPVQSLLQFLRSPGPSGTHEGLWKGKTSVMIATSRNVLVSHVNLHNLHNDLPQTGNRTPFPLSVVAVERFPGSLDAERVHIHTPGEVKSARQYWEGSISRASDEYPTSGRCSSEVCAKHW